MFGLNLGRNDNALQRGVSEFFRLNHKRSDNDYPFRPVAKAVFSADTSTVEVPQPPAYVEPIPQYNYEKPAAVEHTRTLVEAVIDDVPLANRLVAMDWQRRQQQLVTRINSSLPAGCQVASFNIIPAELFVGEVGRFLMIACDFYSHSSGNTLLLPTLPSGAAHLGLPQHPLVTIDSQLADARARIVQLRNRVANEHNRIASAIGRGDLSGLFNKNSNGPAYKQELSNICRLVAIGTIGHSAFTQHESYFGAELRDANS